MSERQKILVPRFQLAPHPKNSIIYRTEDLSGLVDKIRESGWVKELVVSNRKLDETGKYTILSGHSRNMACDILGINEVFVEIKDCQTEEEEIYWILIENEYRTKSNYQKVKEAEYWQLIEGKKARNRQLSGLNNSQPVVENLPQRENGKSRDIIGERVGMSGRSLDDAKFVSGTIQTAEEEGRIEDAKYLKKLLNKSVSGARKIANSNFLDKSDPQLRDLLMSGGITAERAIELADMKIEMTSKLIETLFHQNISKAAEGLSKAEIRHVYGLFKLHFPDWLWHKNLSDRIAAVRYLIRHPKGLNLWRAYFCSNSARELLFNHDLEAKDIYELCRIFGIVETFENKEHAAALLAEKLRIVRYAETANI